MKMNFTTMPYKNLTDMIEKLKIRSMVGLIPIAGC